MVHLSSSTDVMLVTVAFFTFFNAFSEMKIVLYPHGNSDVVVYSECKVYGLEHADDAVVLGEEPTD